MEAPEIWAFRRADRILKEWYGSGNDMRSQDANVSVMLQPLQRYCGDGSDRWRTNDRKRLIRKGVNRRIVDSDSNFDQKEREDGRR